MFKNTKDLYGSVAKFLHWLMAIFIIIMLIFGYFLEDLDDPIYFKIHKANGFILLILACVRLAWRFINITPEYDNSMPKWIKIAAHSGHYSLYFLMIFMPLSAFIASNAALRPVSFFYIFDMPSFFAKKNIELAKSMMDIHKFLALVFIAVIVGHIFAALYHHFYKKDNILKRMLPNWVSSYIMKH